MKKLYFVLGAGDPEMNEIERVLKEQGIGYGYACNSYRRVESKTAYTADRVRPVHGEQSLPVKDAAWVFVECSVFGLPCHHVVDHHRPGDPGHGKPPQAYLEGSSLGQVLTLLGLEPTQRQRVICAADHCLNHAFRGACPGVTPEELAAFRLETRAAYQGVSKQELEERTHVAHEMLQKASKVILAGTPVAWIDDYCNSELAEASARFGIPMMYRETLRDGGMKAGIYSSSPEVISTWMQECQLEGVYGDPARGYAGGYLRA